MPVRLSISERTAAARCVVCHGDLGTKSQRCAQCGATTCAPCAASLTWCPTMGCSTGPPGAPEGLPKSAVGLARRCFTCRRPFLTSPARPKNHCPSCERRHRVLTLAIVLALPIYVVLALAVAAFGGW